MSQEEVSTAENKTPPISQASESPFLGSITWSEPILLDPPFYSHNIYSLQTLTSQLKWLSLFIPMYTVLKKVETPHTNMAHISLPPLPYHNSWNLSILPFVNNLMDHHFPITCV